MLVLTGDYNNANVMIDSIDDKTKEQIESFLNHPAFAHTYIAIMPDCHAGAGSVIGTTMKMNKYVIPNVVGVDIGCGVNAYNLGNVSIDFKNFDAFIKRNIPSGFSHRDTPLLEVEKLPLQTKNLFRQAIDRISAFTTENKVMCQLGTLGGGNHFIEIDVDPDGDKWLIIHTGSRNFGLQVAKYHQNVAKELMETYLINDSLKGLEYLPIASSEGKNYIDDMNAAQIFAKMNRWMIKDLIVQGFFNQFDTDKINSSEIESVHNYINFEDGIIRKGAIQANLGQKLIIPFNMRDGVAVCVGKGSSKWNNSAPHGAGRILSRNGARNSLTQEEYAKSMQGIYTTTATLATIDEAPMAYKDKDIILEAIKETVDVEFLMKPVYNFKAAEEDNSKTARKQKAEAKVRLRQQERLSIKNDTEAQVQEYFYENS